MISTERGLHVYPNPFTTTATIVVMGANLQSGANMILFDMFGREMLKKKVETNIFELNRDQFPAGIYFYRVEDADGTVGSGKIVLE